MTTPPAAASAPLPLLRDRRSLGVVAVFILIYTCLQAFTVVRRSATFDEPVHLAAGYAALAQGDYRFDTAHPPLVRMLASLPLFFRGGPPVDVSAMEGRTTEQWGSESFVVAEKFLFNGRDGDRMLAEARFIIVLIGALLGILVFAWAREWLGFLPAVGTLVIYVTSPNLAAHSALVTTDAGVTCFIFGAVYFLWRAQRRWTFGNAAGTAVFAALAVASKFSAVLLAPIGVALMALAVAAGTALNWRRALALAGLAAATSYAAVWCVYGFSHAPAPGGGAVPVAPGEYPGGVLGLAVAGFQWIDAHHLLPNAFSQGFVHAQLSSRSLGGYLLGEMSAEGWWYYFPAAFLFKTPSVVLVLVATGLVLFCRRCTGTEAITRAFIILPAGLFMAFAMASRVNIGLRHILPVYPFVHLVAGAVLATLLSRRTRAAKVTAWASCAAAVLLFARSYPSNLTFFNLFVGGGARGARYLNDSNLDWGQHLKLLKRWMDENGVSRINLAYFGSVNPAHYGIDCVYLPGSMVPFAAITPPELPGLVAISATMSSGILRPLYAGFEALTPVANLGNTIRIYKVDRWPRSYVSRPDDAAYQQMIGDELLFQVQWYNRAAFHYRAHLVNAPRDAGAWGKLGLADLLAGRPDAAVRHFERAAALEPANQEALERFARALRAQGHEARAAALLERARRNATPALMRGGPGIE